jgi:acetoin utilization protein AcuB
MLVRFCMTPHPVTVTPHDMLITAQEKMTAGRFRRLPVVQDGALVGIVTDRDLRRHVGVEKRTRVGAVMTEHPLTVSPVTIVEEAVRMMLTHQISGLPVVEDGKLIGIITTSDVLRVLLDTMGASIEGSVRIDIEQRERGTDVEAIARLIAELGGEVLSVGTSYRDPSAEQTVRYVRLRGVKPETAVTALRHKGYAVLGAYL